MLQYNTRPRNVVPDFQNSDDVSALDYLEWHFEDLNSLYTLAKAVDVTYFTSFPHSILQNR